MSVKVMKSNFFDRQRVIESIDEASRKSLSKAGAYIRQRARSSMRRRKRSSNPGQAPTVREGSLKRLLFFAWDQGSRSEVVGPAGFKNSMVPEVLEYGGVTTIVRRKNGRLERVQVKIAPRPYMAPALEREKANVPSMFKAAMNSG